MLYISKRSRFPYEKGTFCWEVPPRKKNNNNDIKFHSPIKTWKGFRSARVPEAPVTSPVGEPWSKSSHWILYRNGMEWRVAGILVGLKAASFIFWVMFVLILGDGWFLSIIPTQIRYFFDFLNKPQVSMPVLGMIRDPLKIREMRRTSGGGFEVRSLGSGQSHAAVVVVPVSAMDLLIYDSGYLMKKPESRRWWTWVWLVLGKLPVSKLFGEWVKWRTLRFARIGRCR